MLNVGEENFTILDEQWWFVHDFFSVWKISTEKFIWKFTLSIGLSVCFVCVCVTQLLQFAYLFDHFVQSNNFFFDNEIFKKWKISLSIWLPMEPSSFIIVVQENQLKNEIWWMLCKLLVVGHSHKFFFCFIFHSVSLRFVVDHHFTCHQPNN